MLGLRIGLHFALGAIALLVVPILPTVVNISLTVVVDDKVICVQPLAHDVLVVVVVNLVEELRVLLDHVRGGGGLSGGSQGAKLRQAGGTRRRRRHDHRKMSGSPSGRSEGTIGDLDLGVGEGTLISLIRVGRDASVLLLTDCAKLHMASGRQTPAPCQLQAATG